MASNKKKKQDKTKRTILTNLRVLFSNEIFDNKKDKIIVVDSGIKITELLHGNASESVLFEIK